MSHKETVLSGLGFLVSAPTMVWYISVFFTGTESPFHTVFTVISITALFVLASLLFALGEKAKLAIVHAVLAACAIPFLFLVVSVVGAQSGKY